MRGQLKDLDTEVDEFSDSDGGEGSEDEADSGSMEPSGDSKRSDALYSWFIVWPFF